MADVEHKNLPNAELHEPKGVSAATSGQVYVADGGGSGAWTSQNPAYAQGWVENNTATTTISTVNTPVQVNFGGAFNSDLSNNITIDVNGVFTYNGTKGVTVAVVATLTAEQSSAASKEYSFFVAKNGTIIDSSLSIVETDGGVLSALSLQSLVEVVQNDTIEIWVENRTDTTNLTVEHTSISVAQLGF